MLARVSSGGMGLWRMRWGASSFIVLAVLAGACGSTPEGAAPSTTITATTIASTTTTAPVATTTPTTTTAAPTPTWPQQLGASELFDAYAVVVDWPLVRVTFAQSTSRLLGDGTTDEGEGIEVTETWGRGHVEGHAEFHGDETITTARASGNIELAEIMLGDGIDYVLSGDLLYLPRRVATTLHDGIADSGSEWVSIDLTRLDATGVFVAALLAPFRTARLRPIEEDEPAVHELRFSTDDRATYDIETDTVSQTVELDAEGALRSIKVRATLMLGPFPAIQSLEIDYDPLDTEFVVTGPDDADDITEEFKEYVTARTAAVDLDSNA